MGGRILNSYTIQVAGDPIPQPRPRITVRAGFANAYTPKDHPIHAYRDAIALSWRPRPQLDGPLRLEIELVFTRPKSARKRQWHTVKPDASNVVKGIEDALNGLAWKDDSQVIELVVRKGYGEQAFTRITVTEVEQ